MRSTTHPGPLFASWTFCLAAHCLLCCFLVFFAVLLVEKITITIWLFVAFWFYFLRCVFENADASFIHLLCQSVSTYACVCVFMYVCQTARSCRLNRADTLVLVYNCSAHAHVCRSRPSVLYLFGEFRTIGAVNWRNRGFTGWAKKYKTPVKGYIDGKLQSYFTRNNFNDYEQSQPHTELKYSLHECAYLASFVLHNWIHHPKAAINQSQDSSINQCMYLSISLCYVMLCNALLRTGLHPTAGVLVEEIDHFCPWTGTTIAKKNLKSFYVFVVALFVELLVLVISIILVVHRHHKHWCVCSQKALGSGQPTQVFLYWFVSSFALVSVLVFYRMYKVHTYM